MRNIVVYSKRVGLTIPATTVTLNGSSISCGLITTEKPHFDCESPQHRDKVLIKTIAFSCNYRDLSFMHLAVKRDENSFWVIGSEFIGEVIKTGSQVTSLRAGDRVIGNNDFSDIRAKEQGIPTNNASKEYQILPASQLVAIPPGMPDIIGAAFSLGSQTAYSMLRKLNVTANSNVLVTAAKSNTSLFIINALKKHKVNIYATSTSMKFGKQLEELGVKELIQINQDTNFSEHNSLGRIAKELNYFDYVIDPFFDLHLGRAVFIMAPGGKYITCGTSEQYGPLAERVYDNSAAVDFKAAIGYAMLNNLHIIGNCLGQTQDLRQAIQDYISGELDIVIDSIFCGDAVGSFLEKTYCSKERFGKVVYKYD